MHPTFGCRRCSPPLRPHRSHRVCHSHPDKQRTSGPFLSSASAELPSADVHVVVGLTSGAHWPRPKRDFSSSFRTATGPGSSAAPLLDLSSLTQQSSSEWWGATRLL